MDYGIIKDHTVFLGNTKIVKMSQISQKDLYEDAILYKSKDHSHQISNAPKYMGKMLKSIMHMISIDFSCWFQFLTRKITECKLNKIASINKVWARTF